MADQYSRYIEKSKAPKKASTVKTIVSWIMLGIRKGYDTKLLAEKLNTQGIKTVLNKPWTYHSLQMQILKMARLDSDSSLAWGLAMLIHEGKVSPEDLELLEARTR